jgi:hypothetical protein
MTIIIPIINEDAINLDMSKIVLGKEKTDNSILTFTDGFKRPLPGKIMVEKEKKCKSTTNATTDTDTGMASGTRSKIYSHVSNNSGLLLSNKKNHGFKDLSHGNMPGHS